MYFTIYLTLYFNFTDISKLIRFLLNIKLPIEEPYNVINKQKKQNNKEQNQETNDKVGKHKSGLT